MLLLVVVLIKTKTFTVTLDAPETWMTEVTDAFNRAKLNAVVK